MANPVMISKAAALAVHSMMLLVSAEGKRLSVKEIAHRLNVSESHLAKVVRRLVRVGLLASMRGPSGGVALKRPPEDVTLLDIYEAVDGPIEAPDCLLGFIQLLWIEFRKLVGYGAFRRMSAGPFAKHLAGREHVSSRSIGAVRPGGTLSHRIQVG